MTDEKKAWLRQLGVTTLAPASAEAEPPAGKHGKVLAGLRTSASFSIGADGGEVLNIGGPTTKVTAPPPAPPPLAPPPPTTSMRDTPNLAPAAPPPPAPPTAAPPMRGGPEDANESNAEREAEADEELLNIVAAFGEQHDQAPPPPEPDKAGLSDQATQEGFSIPGIPIPLPEPEIKVTVLLDNQSDHDLKLIPASVKLENPNGSGFDTKPPPIIGKRGRGNMALSNNFPFLTGVGGELAYALADDPQTTIFIKWERGRVPRRNHVEEVRPANPDKFSISGGFNGDDFTFTFVGIGGGPGPNPGPATDVEANCQVTVTNNTQVELELTDQAHEIGDFMTFPAQKLAPGAATSFVSTRTKGDKTPGCKGHLTWNVGGGTAVWRVEWNNPVGEKNTATAEINPAAAGFDSLEQIGQGEENVPVAFTLSGGSPGPGPGPGPGPEPEKPFVPPPEAKQPTLRQGDNTADGWVEYLQRLLGVPVDGKFGPATKAAVIAFQQKNGLQVDGTVGNQTWAALRGETPEAPSTDGRQPHTFEEAGKEARFFRDNEQCVFFPSEDQIAMMIESMGDDADIEGRTVTFVITPPGGKASNATAKIGPVVERSPTGTGNLHQVNLSGFLRDHPSNPPGATADQYQVDAFLEGDLGGDHWKGHPTPQ